MKYTIKRSQLLWLSLLLMLAALTIQARFGASLSWQRKNAAPALITQPARVSKSVSPALVAAPVQSGGSYNITQSVIAGGGDKSAGGNITITGTIGQNNAGASSGGSYTVGGGFWAGTTGGCAAITVSPLDPALPSGTTGTFYSQQFTQMGGSSTIIWSISTGAPPVNVTINSSSGLLSGTPATSGTFNFTARATDANGCFGERPYTLTITNLALTINSVTPPAGRTEGGQQIVLTGSFANLLTVTVGGIAATWNFTSGTTQITVTTPPHAAGAVNIVLTPTAGSPYTKTNAFAYLPTVFTDNTLVAGVTTAKAQHILELRQAVDALRAVAGLAPAAWTDPTLLPASTVIKAIHITEMRSNLESAAALLGYSPGSYTDPALISGIPIKRLHIEDLRQRLRNIAG